MKNSRKMNRSEGAAVWNFTVMFLDHWNRLTKHFVDNAEAIASDRNKACLDIFGTTLDEGDVKPSRGKAIFSDVFIENTDSKVLPHITNPDENRKKFKGLRVRVYLIQSAPCSSLGFFSMASFQSSSSDDDFFR